MTDDDRRTVLKQIAGVAALAPLGGACAAGQVSDPAPLAAVTRLLSGLPQSAAGGEIVSADVATLFADGWVLAGPVGAGRILLDGVRQAIAVLPLRSGTRTMELAVVATLARTDSGKLRIAGIRGLANPFDSLAAPTSGALAGEAAIDIQREYDRLAQSGGGTLTLPPGDLAINLVLHTRNVHLSGAGRRATRLLPRDPALPVLRATYRDGSWDYVTIANLDIAGRDGVGTGFVAGSDPVQAGDEFAGRTRFVNVGFADLTTALRRDAGQIGLLLDQCTFGPAEVHLLSRSSPGGREGPMHAGILIARACHFTGARQAVARIDSPVVGTGGVLFDGCIMERNPGFIFYVESFPNVDAVTDFVVRDCWNEMNGSSREVTIGGSRERVAYARFSNTGMARFEGTPLGPLDLRNSVVTTYGCALDNLSVVHRDRASTITHHEARGFGGYAPVGVVASIAAAAQSEPPGRALTFSLPPQSLPSPTPVSGDILLASRGKDPLLLMGTVPLRSTEVRDPLAPDGTTVQEIRLIRGMRVFPPSVAIPPRSWIVWLFTYRLVDGGGASFQVSGDRGISAIRSLDARGWETLGGMAEVQPGTRETSLWMIQEDAECTLRLGNFALAAFSDRQQALKYLNFRTFNASHGRTDPASPD